LATLRNGAVSQSLLLSQLFIQEARLFVWPPPLVQRHNPEHSRIPLKRNCENIANFHALSGIPHAPPINANVPRFGKFCRQGSRSRHARVQKPQVKPLPKRNFRRPRLPISGNSSTHGLSIESS
jgi:hypothetical protein